MEYSEEQFFTLMNAVEEIGGQHVDVQCKSREFKMSGNRGKPVRLAGCGNHGVFRIPYPADYVTGKPGEIVACAFCDAVGLWPRFIEQVMS